MKKSTAFSLGMIGLLLGIIIGFLMSPVKYGIDIGNNSGNVYSNPIKDEADGKSGM